MHGNEYFDLAIMLLVGYACAKVAQRIWQSAMVGRMAAGILIGVVLGWIANSNPALHARVYPEEFSKWVTLVAGFGLTLYQGSCGTHIKRDKLPHGKRTYWAVMLAGIAAPMLLGGMLGWILHPGFSFPHIPRIVFAGVIGLCFSLTSIVAISLSLGEFHLKNSGVGSVSLKCATTEDGVAWFILPFFLALLPTVVSPNMGVSTLSILGFLLFMWFPVRLGLERWMPRDLNKFDVYAIYFGLLMLVAGISSWLGLHALFGAMLFGMVIPRTDDFAHRLEHKIQWPIEELFVPLFLINSGMQCSFQSFTWDLVWLSGVIVALATASKFGACALAARYIGGNGWRESLVIGLAMNTRGLMTLMLLTVAQDHGLMNKEMYTMLVIMALLTTGMTSWGLHLVGAKKLAHQKPADRRHDAHPEAERRPVPALQVPVSAGT